MAIRPLFESLFENAARNEAQNSSLKNSDIERQSAPEIKETLCESHRHQENEMLPGEVETVSLDGSTWIKRGRHAFTPAPTTNWYISKVGTSLSFQVGRYFFPLGKGNFKSTCSKKPRSNEICSVS